MRSLAPVLALAALSALGAASSVDAQSSPSAEASASSLRERPRVFLDCDRGCDFDYLRTEIKFVDYVRNHRDADLHVLVTTRRTGAGGTEYTLRLLGQHQFAGMDDELRHVTRPVDSRDEVRRGLAQVLEAGLVRYALQTPVGRQLRVSYSAPKDGRGVPTAMPAVDPWNAWVFRTRIGGFSNGESTYRSTNLDGSVSAGRTTEDWKARLSANTQFRENRYRVAADSTISSIRRDHYASALLVKSINGHWSLGGRASASHSTFRNRDLALRLAPAVEYSFFPYAESTRRQLTLQYSVGANQIDYAQETIFGKTHEVLADEALVAAYDVTQRWGSIRTSLEGSHYFHDKSKYRVEGTSNLEVRLTRVVSLNFYGNAEHVRDQIHLARGELTPAQILLRQQQAATSFRYYGSVGLGFSFGSIYNTVVNPRLGE